LHLKTTIEINKKIIIKDENMIPIINNNSFEEIKNLFSNGTGVRESEGKSVGNAEGVCFGVGRIGKLNISCWLFFMNLNTFKIYLFTITQ